MDIQNKGLIANDANTGVAFSSFLGTVSLFFTGLLIAQFNSFDPTIRIPVLYLVISTFAFIFSATIYANTLGVVMKKIKLANNFIKAGNAISEYLGIYLFIMSIPLVINAVSKDTFLRFSIGIVTVLSIYLYSISDFSMFNRHITNSTKTFISILITSTGAALFLSQMHFVQHFTLIAAIYLLINVGTTIFYYRKEG